jgi:hypothetical protein
VHRSAWCSVVANSPPVPLIFDRVGSHGLFVATCARPLQDPSCGPRKPVPGCESNDVLCTVVKVNVETMLRIAEADELSPSLQMRLWSSADPLVRRALARRGDLLDDLAVEVVRDPTLVSSWASVSRPAGQLLATAITTAADEHSLMGLIRQVSLDADQAKDLAGRCGPIVGWYMIENQSHLLTDEVASALVHAYVSAMEPRSDGPGRVFEDTLGDNDALWAAAASAVTLDTLPILRAVATRSCTRPGLQYAVVESLERLDDDTGSLDERKQRSIDAIAEQLLHNPQLTQPLVERIAALRCLGPDVDVTLRRQLDLVGLLDSLGCDPQRVGPCDDADHVDALQRLSGLPTEVRLPGDLVTLSALMHREQLTAQQLRTLLEACRGPVSRQVAARLSESGRIAEVVALVEHLGTPCLDTIEDPLPVLLTLARNGSKLITDRNVGGEYRFDVVGSYRPLYNLLRESGLTSVALEAIENLEPVSRDVALGLIGEWEGDLNELLTTATSLAVSS